MEDSSVDLFLQDTPFGVTQNEWDVAPDLEKMWPEWLRVGKSNCAFLFFATQPFASDLINSNRALFRYDMIWYKSRPTGFLNANKMPLRNHEHIIIFYRQLPTYNPQKERGNPNHVANGKMCKTTANNNYGDFGNKIQFITEKKHPKSVIYFEQQDPNKIFHPTQKPVDLFRYLIKTYSNPNELVFDGYSGSGTTAIAASMEDRKAICCELDADYHRDSVKRFNNHIIQGRLL